MLFLDDYISKLITPYFINGVAITGLDLGVTHSIISLTWTKLNNLEITPINGVIHQVIQISEVPRIGQI